MHDVALNALSNASAMETLHKGFGGKPKRRFLKAADAGVERVKTTMLPGVVAYVLGPYKNETVIRDMDPPAGRTYLKRVSEGGAPVPSFEPFGPEWALDAAGYKWGALVVPPSDVKQLQELSDAADLGVTVSLDKAVNGTSLVLVFEIGSAVLLFPGDAQWGTWNAILEDDDARELISRANFWKVGHHGSHNATPREFVDDVLQNNCCAMMSTKTGKWASIPRQPLVDKLETMTKFARSDVVQQRPGRPFSLSSKSVTEARISI
jgi:hypothetical protein